MSNILQLMPFGIRHRHDALVFDSSTTHTLATSGMYVVTCLGGGGNGESSTGGAGGGGGGSAN